MELCFAPILYSISGLGTYLRFSLHLILLLPTPVYIIIEKCTTLFNKKCLHYNKLTEKGSQKLDMFSALFHVKKMKVK